MMNFKKITALVLVIAMIFTVVSSVTFVVEVQAQQQEMSFSDDYLESVRKLIKQKYSGEITDEDLNKTTVEEMFDTLDDYSVFYSQSEFDGFMNSLGGEVHGIGINVEQIGDYVTVTNVFDKSPAQKAGILKGDKITKVDGISVVKANINDVVDRITGEVNTKVKLSLLRQNISGEITVEAKRARIDVPSVSYEIRGDIGYILLDMFSANADSGIKEALGYFDSKKVTKVVLDLRNNPGGLLDQAVAVAKLFVPKGLITKLDYKDEEIIDEEYYSELKSLKYKLAVLVNENSASASEIFTGAIKDTNAGVVLGNKTFGKAKVQSVVPILSPEAFERLNKGSYQKTVNAFAFPYALDSDLLGWAKMTMGMYYTPKGESIDKKGIEPDIYVEEGSLSVNDIRVNELRPLNVAVKPALDSKCNDVFSAECILKLLKYDVDTPDNILDKRTVAAITKFQKDNKVYGYGVLDYCTQNLLNEKLDKLKETQDAVYVKAVEVLKN
jgi:carboxyl-terminal processing protease